MAKWETPRHLSKKLATRAERNSMTRVQLGMRTCEYCAGTFRSAEDSITCESWHKSVFRQMRRDLAEAIGRLNAEISSGRRNDKESVRQLKRLAEQMRKVPNV